MNDRPENPERDYWPRRVLIVGPTANFGRTPLVVWRAYGDPGVSDKAIGALVYLAGAIELAHSPIRPINGHGCGRTMCTLAPIVTIWAKRQSVGVEQSSIAHGL